MNNSLRLKDKVNRLESGRVAGPLLAAALSHRPLPGLFHSVAFSRQWHYLSGLISFAAFRFPSAENSQQNAEKTESRDSKGNLFR
jgi:hypothetical protein